MLDKAVNMIIGIGTDIFNWKHIRHLDGSWDEPFFVKTYTLAERSQALGSANPLRYFAGRFAAKEAIIKALNNSLDALRFSQIEVLDHDDGSPEAKLIDVLDFPYPKAKIFISISHEEDISIALAVLEAFTI